MNDSRPLVSRKEGRVRIRGGNRDEEEPICHHPLFFFYFLGFEIHDNVIFFNKVINKISLKNTSSGMTLYTERL